MLTWIARPEAMHVPDGFLTPGVALLFWLLSALFVGVALQRAQGQLGPRQAPVLGVLAAFIFAAQMLNFPVAGGTSGHLLGGALATLLLGPWAAILVMTAVVGVQALFFQDGGLLALGANLFNMGILPALLTYGLTRWARPRGRAYWALAALAAWFSVVVGALLTALQLAWSGVALFGVVVPAMLGVHALIGVGEALITLAALRFVFRVRPEVVTAGEEQERRWAVIGLALTGGLLLLSPFASSLPDGLERVAHDLGFIGREQAPAFQVFADYTIPWLGNAPLSTVLAGAVGAALVLGLLYLLSRWLGRSKA